MRSILLAVALASLGVQAAYADGAERWQTEGTIKVRYYIEHAFLINQFQLPQYNNLRSDLTITLQDLGKHDLGLNFLEDAAGNLRSVTLKPPAHGPVYTRQEIVDDFIALVPVKTGVVNVLIHAYGVTVDGQCGLDVPGGNSSSEDEGDTVPAPNDGVNGIATGTVTVTAKGNCSVSDLSMKSIPALKDTFVHEIGHILLLNHEFPPNKNCTTRPTAGVMCQQVGPGIFRSYKKWFLSDVQQARTAYFGASRKFPVLACYEWSSRAACDTTCVNVAGFPDPGATDVYNACVAAQCNHICAH